MQHLKLTAMVLVLTASAAISAGAQILVQAPPADTQNVVVSPPTAVVIEQAPAVVLLPIAPNPVPDPAADMKCRYLAPADYWDCVNSHSGS